MTSDTRVEGVLEKSVEIDLQELGAVSRWASTQGAVLRSLWQIPGRTVRLAVIERPGDGQDYGSQVAVIAPASNGYQFAYVGKHLNDADFVHPTVFSLPGRTLVLADVGSDDAWGCLVLCVEAEKVEDLGTIPAASPPRPGGDIFLAGVAASARVRLEPDGYRIGVPGPIIYFAGGQQEELIARTGEVVWFRLSAGRWEWSKTGR